MLSYSPRPIGLSWAYRPGAGEDRLAPRLLAYRRRVRAQADTAASRLPPTNASYRWLRDVSFDGKSHDHPATHRSPKVHVPLVLDPCPTDALRPLFGGLFVGQPAKQLSAATCAPLRERGRCLPVGFANRHP